MKIAKGVHLETYLEVDVEVIEVRAYYIWEKNGKPDGRSEEFFYQAQNEIFSEAKESLVKNTGVDDFKEDIDWLLDVNEVDDTWYSDIEEVMPEIKHMKFRNVSQKISWMFNNLKKFKPVNKQTDNQQFVESLIESNPVEEEEENQASGSNNIELPENVPLVINELIPEVINETAIPIIDNNNVENVVIKDNVLKPCEQVNEEKVYNSLNDTPSITEDNESFIIPPSKLTDERVKEMYSVDKLAELSTV